VQQILPRKRSRMGQRVEQFSLSNKFIILNFRKLFIIFIPIIRVKVAFSATSIAFVLIMYYICTHQDVEGAMMSPRFFLVAKKYDRQTDSTRHCSRSTAR
jgi:hypothetical protein